jgi:hypothetical protein
MGCLRDPEIGSATKWQGQRQSVSFRLDLGTGRLRMVSAIAGHNSYHHLPYY